MNSEVVDFLMSQPNGANYVVLYQMLCLKTINTGGRLTCQIGDVIIPFDMGKIQRDCKWFSLDTIRIALGLYKQLGLIYEEQDGTLVLVNHAEMVGSETDYAEKNRRMRSNAANKRLQAGQYSGHESGHNVSADCGENVPIDIRDKRKDIRDMPFVRRGNYSFRVLSDITRLQSSDERETVQTVHRHRCRSHKFDDSIMRQFLRRILGA